MEEILPVKMVAFEASLRGGPAELVVASEENAEKIKKRSAIIRLATMEDLQTAMEVGHSHLLIEIAEGVHVLSPEKKYRKLQKGESFFYPVMDSVLSAEADKRQMLSPLARIQGPGWKVSFCLAGFELKMEAIYNTRRNRWRFDNFAFSQPSVCDYCQTLHTDLDFCPFYGDYHVQNFLGAQAISDPLFAQRAKETAGKWRLQMALKGAFRAFASSKKK